MRFGWEQAVRHMEFDHLFVYNDDVRLEPTALADLLAACTDRPGPVVVAGSFLSLDGRRTTYGGRRRSSRRHPLKFAGIVEPDGTVQEADTLNMNGALISKSALDSVGFLSNYFVHSGADFEYGLKLRKAGGRVLVAPRYIGRCDMNPASEQLPENEASLRDGLRENEASLRDGLRKLFDSKREPFRQRLAYYRRHGGWLWPAWWVAPYVTIWFRHLARWLKRARSTVPAP
jgi:GT2 family glycosyltransferase